MPGSAFGFSPRPLLGRRAMRPPPVAAASTAASEHDDGDTDQQELGLAFGLGGRSGPAAGALGHAPERASRVPEPWTVSGEFTEETRDEARHPARTDGPSECRRTVRPRARRSRCPCVAPGAGGPRSWSRVDARSNGDWPFALDVQPIEQQSLLGQRLPEGGFVRFDPVADGRLFGGDDGRHDAVLHAQRHRHRAQMVRLELQARLANPADHLQAHRPHELRHHHLVVRRGSKRPHCGRRGQHRIRLANRRRRDRLDRRRVVGGGLRRRRHVRGQLVGLVRRCDHSRGLSEVRVGHGGPRRIGFLLRRLIVGRGHGRLVPRRVGCGRRAGSGGLVGVLRELHPFERRLVIRHRTVHAACSAAAVLLRDSRDAGGVFGDDAFGAGGLIHRRVVPSVGQRPFRSNQRGVG